MGVLAMVVTEVTALDTATERGPLMLRPSPRPMPGWDTVGSTATAVLALVMEVMAMVDLATDMARGPLMLRLSHGWDMVDSTATVVLALAMAVMAMVDSDTAMDLDSMARSKRNQIPRLTISYNTPNDLTKIL